MEDILSIVVEEHKDRIAGSGYDETFMLDACNRIRVCGDMEAAHARIMGFTASDPKSFIACMNNVCAVMRGSSYDVLYYEDVPESDGAVAMLLDYGFREVSTSKNGIRHMELDVSDGEVEIC